MKNRVDILYIISISKANICTNLTVIIILI